MTATFRCQLRPVCTENSIAISVAIIARPLPSSYRALEIRRLGGLRHGGRDLGAEHQPYFGGKKLRPSECVFSAAAPVKEVKCSSVKGIPLGASSIPVRGIGAREGVYDFCGS